MLFGTGQYWLRYNSAKNVAIDWLREHHYRVVEFRYLWLGVMAFAPRLFRNANNAFSFEAVVNDSDLGGTGTVRLRVWTSWLGIANTDVDVVWKEMPEGGTEGGNEDRTDGVRPLGDRLADAQLGLLHRIAAGETAFYAPREGAGDGSGAEYDEMVEHLLALTRRGMITCTQPGSGTRGWTQYSNVANVALTDEGRKVASSDAGDK